MIGDWQIHLFVPETSPRPWQDAETAEAWAQAHHAWFTAGPEATLGWFGFQLGAPTALSLADEVERGARETGEDALLRWMADLRDLVSPSLLPRADFVWVEPASFQRVALWSFSTASEDAAAEMAASLRPIEHSVWAPGTAGFWIDVATAHMLLRVRWGGTGTLSVLRAQLWSWLVDRDADRINAHTL